MHKPMSNKLLDRPVGLSSTCRGCAGERHQPFRVRKNSRALITAVIARALFGYLRSWNELRPAVLPHRRPLPHRSRSCATGPGTPVDTDGVAPHQHSTTLNNYSPVHVTAQSAHRLLMAAFRLAGRITTISETLSPSCIRLERPCCRTGVPFLFFSARFPPLGEAHNTHRMGETDPQG